MPTTVLGEFVGMTTLMLFGDGVVANVLLAKSKGQGGGWIAITTGWAVAVLLGILVASALGAPGELNPAVTVANVLLGARTTHDAAWHIAAQFAGALVGATLVWLQYLPHWRETKEPEVKLGVFCNAPAIRHAPANLGAEIVGTFALVFVANAVAQAVTIASPIGEAPSPLVGALVGALVWGIGLSLGGSTGYAINPARDLGPRIAHALLPIAGKGGSDWGYAWIPVVGPVIGGALAAWAWQAAR
jgi:glycerol uptake facilitator protein